MNNSLILILSLIFTTSNAFGRSGHWEARKQACEGKSLAQECSFQRDDKNIEGTCEKAIRSDGLMCGAGDRKHSWEGKVFNELNLTEDQMKQIKELKRTQRGKYKEIKTRMKALREEMKNKFVATSHPAELEKVHAQIQELQIKKNDLQFEKMSKLQSILNEEQRKKYIEQKDESRRGHRRGKNHHEDSDSKKD